nr:hypothetical protein [Actinacidiphila oryziradicis]
MPSPALGESRVEEVQRFGAADRSQRSQGGNHERLTTLRTQIRGGHRRARHRRRHRLHHRGHRRDGRDRLAQRPGLRRQGGRLRRRPARDPGRHRRRRPGLDGLLPARQVPDRPRPVQRRWHQPGPAVLEPRQEPALRATDATESGTGDGSDFALVRYDDSGAAIDTPIAVRRTNGRITLGQFGGTATNVLVNANANPGLTLVQALAAGQGYAITGADTSSRAFQASVTGDSANRLAIDINGTQSFGPGGSGARDTSWGRLGAGQIGSADSDLVAGLAGKGLKVKEGSNAKMGTLTLNGATAVTVTTTTTAATTATTASRIFLTVQAPGGTPSGVAYVAGRTAGTSFTVKGAAGDTSTVAWLIVEPA